MSVFFLALAVLAGFFSVAPHSGIDAKIAPIVAPHRFSIAGWELRALAREQTSSGARQATVDDVSTVIDYFLGAKDVRSLESRLDEAEAGAPLDQAAIRADLASLRGRQVSMAEKVESIIEKQVTETLRGQGIYNPFVRFTFSFPAVKFELVRPPDVLVVSPRSHIESITQTMLSPDLALSDAEDIESRVDALDVSSLVTGIGGLAATYPTLVADDMDLRYTIETATHEWVHQYLAFRPLGFRYVLDAAGLAQDPDIRSMNETVADMVGKEIGDMVYEKYYREAVAAVSGQPPAPGNGETTEEPKPSFDFSAEMRAIRKQVDLMLSQGKIDEAEQYMNERRDYLASHGYYIRKLNQAYFAFYGSYTDSPTSVDPIGVEMKQLRSESGSIKEFLTRASSITSREELEKTAGP